MKEFVRAALELACGQMKVAYVPMNTKQPYDEALAGYLASRRGR